MQARLHIITFVYALYNKGVNVLALPFLLKKEKNGKKIAKYLVVPNICILSLSLSLSLVMQA